MGRRRSQTDRFLRATSSGKAFVAVRVVTSDDDVLEIRHPPRPCPSTGEQRFRDEQHALRAAIRQHIGVLIREFSSVLNGTGTMPARITPRKHGRKIDRIQHDHRHTLFAADAETAQHVGERGQLCCCRLAIGQFGDGVGEGELAAAPLIDIAVEQPGHCIIGSGVVGTGAVQTGRAAHDASPRL